MSDHETHNRIVPEIFRRLIKETGSEEECMVALESIVFGVIKFYRPNPKHAAEYLDIMTIEVTQEDRELLKFLLASHEEQACRIDAGLAYTIEVESIARHRQAAYDAGKRDGMRETGPRGD